MLLIPIYCQLSCKLKYKPIKSDHSVHFGYSNLIHAGSKFLSELLNCAQNEEDICKKHHGHLLHRSGLTLLSINELPAAPIWSIFV